MRAIGFRHAGFNLRKNPRNVIPKGGVCPRSLLFLGNQEEKQIPRVARDDKKYFFRRLFSLRGLVIVWTNPRRLKPAPQNGRIC